jgi:hypothetical protein
VKLAHIHAGDLVEINKRGRRFYGRVLETGDGIVQFEPLCPGISYRHATAREIVHHWRKTGRHGPGPADELDSPEPIPREQLPLLT